MPIHHTIWRIEETPQPLSAGKLPSESMLEQMIVAAPQIVSLDWLIIGQQVMTDSGGRVDLLALAPDGSVVPIKPKRNQGKPGATSECASKEKQATKNACNSLAGSTN